MNTKEKKLKLCYIEGEFAYFTSLDLDKQWGDDWNDAPYEHNAGEPYKDGIIKKVAFEGDFAQPTHGYSNCPYSVEQINQRKIAWLRPHSWSDHNKHIFAGTTLEDFIKEVKDAKGEIYLPI